MESVELRAAPSPAPPRPRVQAINRRQMVLRPMEVEQLIGLDHPARAIWQLVGQRDLSRFYAEIKAVEGTAGREAVDPCWLISLWIYAYSEKISSAREIQRRCEQFHPGFGWLTGLTVINHHTLSDFRTAHGAALEQLFVEVLGVLSQAGVVSLQRVMHDGTKIKANAADNSFRREPSLRQHLETARQQVAQLERESAEDRASLTDPEARIMKQAQGAIGPAYNVQISTDAKERSLWESASARPPPMRPSWPRRSSALKPTPGANRKRWWWTAASPIKGQSKPWNNVRSG